MATANQFGLYTLQLGNGDVLKGDMKKIKWELGNKYISVAIDPIGGDQYIEMGNTELLSVPFAIYADKSGEVISNPKTTRTGFVSTSSTGTGTTNYLSKFTAANTINNAQLHDNGVNIGIGTAYPQAKFHMTGVGGMKEFRIQSVWGSPRLSFFGDNSTSFSNTANYASMYKRPSTDT